MIGMWDDLRTGRYGIDILALTAIISAVLLHEYWAAMLVVIMLTGGKSLEDFAEHRSKSELNALLERAPQIAHVLKGTKIVDVPVNKVQVNDKLIIKPGEVVPVDAIILEGVSTYDESSLTGESLPLAKSKGDQILSGSINLDGSITAKAIHTAKDSQYQQIIKLVGAAQHSQAPFVRLADRYSIPFTVLAFVIAGSVWFMSGDAVRFLQVIIVATPCPLLLAAPIALVSGMSRASKYGIVVKTGSALEKLACIQTMAFDKTGTLTRGEPKVDSVKTFGEFNQADVLSAAASLEQSSNHILARAIVEAAQAKKLSIGKAKHVTESAGHGLSARLNNKNVLVGRYDFMLQYDVELPKDFSPKSVQQTATYVAIGGIMAGVITFVDEVRPETKDTLNRIRKLGIKNFLMLTGDNQAAAQAVAKKLAIDNFESNALPGNKVEALEKVEHRPVAFVGDGVNDAPALTTADIGIALGARGSTAASESADVVILQDDLSHVVAAVEVAQKAFGIAKQSILIGIGISVGLMLIFATGKFSPILGAVLQEVVDVIVIFYALRAHNIKISDN